ncbi:ABC transporter permease subunit [Alkalihalobacillus sp. CinArs1]|uniref:ABC transporter permease subunit n=1 Tax=Alkalihalobacillus sp. CinArs1 TaxID=2995314 RepID=UPI0022DE4261|nr:ABC transporter permease subunit [Alkalihalobacillus sp. CinArs1]
MNVGKFLGLELKRNVISLPLFLSIGLSLALGSGIIYSIHELGGPFQPRNVAGLYATIAMVALGIYSAKVVVADLHHGTIYLLFSSTGDRITFLVSRLVVMGAVSTLFGIGCGVLLYVNHVLNGQAFSWSDVGVAILHYVLFGLFFTLLFFVISMFYQKTMNIMIIALVTILVLPGILGMVQMVESLPAFAREFIGHLPLYTLTNTIGFLAMEGYDMMITVFVSLGLFAFAFIKLPKVDY